MRKLGISVFCLSLALATFGVRSLVLAGPPLVCVQFDNGGHPSLPWSETGWKESDPSYDTANLARDTTALLEPDAPVLARMETLRRAALYSAKDPKAGAELLGALKSRIKDGRKAKPAALSLFDLGYFADTYRQALRVSQKPEFREIDGYNMVAEALEGIGHSPEIEFAAALMLAENKLRKRDHDRHLRNALDGVREGTLLARNLVSHYSWRGKDLKALRASLE